LSEEIYRGQMMFGRECDNSWGLEKSQIVAKNHYCIGALGDGRRKGNVQFLGLGRLNCRQLHVKVPGCAGYLVV
jgi:hypothetical protein